MIWDRTAVKLPNGEFWPIFPRWRHKKPRAERIHPGFLPIQH